MRISVINPSTVVLEGDDEVREWRVSKRLRPPGYQFVPAFRKGHWDGWKYPGRWFKKRLYLGRGLLTTVQADFPSVPIEYAYSVPRLILSDLPSTLHDYQTEALEQIAEQYWCRVAFATNAGKGAVIALAARAAYLEGYRTLILADEIEVFRALQEEIAQWSGVTPGLVESGVKEPPTNHVILAMVPTLSRRVNDSSTWCTWLNTFDMLLADEADKATAKTWQRILARAQNTLWRVGFSGTFPAADTVNALVLDETIGLQLERRVRNKELVERGISARPLVELHPHTHPGYSQNFLSKYKGGPAKRQAVYETGIVHNEKRHHFVLSLLDHAIPNVVIVNRIEHGRHLQRTFTRAGFKSVFLRGEHTKDERLGALEAFRRGDVSILIATRILDRGTNLLGHAVGLVFASGEGSNRQTLQRIGRGLRRAGGKEFVYIRDVIDRGHKYLNNASRKRVELYNSEGFEIRICE